MNIKRQKIKKNIFLSLSIISGFIFLSGCFCTILGDKSPIKFILNNSPVKVITPPLIIFVVTYTLYKNSKKVLEDNKK